MRRRAVGSGVVRARWIASSENAASVVDIPLMAKRGALDVSVDTRVDFALGTQHEVAVTGRGARAIDAVCAALP